MVVNFENESNSMLQTLFEMLRHNLGNEWARLMD